MKVSVLLIALLCFTAVTHTTVADLDELTLTEGNLKGDWIVKASVFYDKTGTRDNNLYDGKLYYAELSKNPKAKDFSAMGKLKFGQALRITYKGKSVIAYKGDVGAGGPQLPVIDLHINLAKALNFDINKGIDNVKIELL